MTRVVLSGGSSCSSSLAQPLSGGKRKKYNRKSMKRGSRKSKAMKKHMKKSRRHSRKGGSRMLHRAALPFGLLALQKMMHRSKTRKSLKKLGKRVLRAPYRTAKFLL